MVQIVADYTEMEREIDRIAGMPNAGMSAMLDATWTEIFESTQAATHVETGSLKSSGKMTSDTHGENWSGDIEYGGISAGVHNPVNYAIYEYARGGSHDFLANATLSQAQMIETLVEGLAHAK